MYAFYAIGSEPKCSGKEKAVGGLSCSTGQGAGVAAAISVKHDQSTSKVDIELVQQELKRQGVRIH